MASLIGKTLGKYQVIERLGRGGMAEVYKAFHPQLERYTAIKVLNPFLAEGEDFLARFQREARAIAALQHPNIVQVFDVEVADETYYMVIEFVAGGTLKDRMLAAQGPLPMSDVEHIFLGIASALDYAHRNGILHRDVKPANVLLDDTGRVVLTDFGIARIVSDSQFTVTGTLVGTPAYMSPEQGMGISIEATSDIYSLGIVLYEMITGQVPFESDTPLSIIHKQINDPLPAPRSIRDDIPQALEQLILKSLSKEPGDRFTTVAEMIAAAQSAFAEIDRVSQSETIVEAPSSMKGEQASPSVSESSPVQPVIQGSVATEKEAPPVREAVQPVSGKATVAMSPEEAAAFESEIPPASEPVKVVEQPARAPEPPRRPVVQSSSRRKIAPKTIIIAVVGLLALALALVFVVPNLLGGAADCNSIPECERLAEELRGQNDPGGAISALAKAINYVPANEHPGHAHLWCQKGDAHQAIDQVNDAIRSFEECQDWTEGDPAFEEQRMFAQEQLDHLIR
jgi:serine/threonine protein kinase